MPVIRKEETQAALKRLGLRHSQLPQHIAIIMDGNGRWARRRRLPRVAGHKQGVRSVRAVVEECCRLGIDCLTLFCLSSENWKRPKAELSFLMRLLRQYVIEERQLIMEQQIQMRTIGRREGIPDEVLAEVDKTVQMSRVNRGMILCLAINYGARGEIVDAAKQIARHVRAGRLKLADIDEKLFAAYLYTAELPDPDLVIRTAGEMRLSNFLLWQLSYAELWVTPICWPEFREQHLHEALRDYARRERRFGGLVER